MTTPANVARDAASRREARRLDIRRAAIDQFMSHGYAATSMANIAVAAGVSRPALYQYFTDKDDIFVAAFAGVFEALVDAATAELQVHADVRDALDGMLQRYDGDLWELMASSPHHAELTEAKNPAVAAAVDVEVNRLWVGVAEFLEARLPGRGQAVRTRRAEALDLLRWSPAGLRRDEPDMATYRFRLGALARAVATVIETR